MRRENRKIMVLLLMVWLIYPLYSQKSRGLKTVHVIVALCDNVYQGIVKVPVHLGNGQEPGSNLYWGARFGIKASFSRNRDWTAVKTWKSPGSPILERVLFKHRSGQVYLLADAYDGKAIREAIIHFLSFASGSKGERIVYLDKELDFGGGADIIAYVGHNGLMDFSLTGQEIKTAVKGVKERETIILACLSHSYFQPYIRRSGAYPLIWTTGLMAPESYTLEAILRSKLSGESREKVLKEAARAYHQYQKCGLKSALRLFKTGW